MKTEIINSLSELEHLIARLDNRSKTDIYRGQPDSRYKLIPNAFRPDTLKKNAKNFPVPQVNIKLWFKNKTMMETLNFQFSGQLAKYARALFFFIAKNSRGGTFKAAQ